ncbi:MAG: hypothetical protein ACRELY_22945 [Polyangiaceae bacterium]
MPIGARAGNDRFARRAACLLVAAIGVSFTASACLPEGRYCSPGDFRSCTTSNGAPGAAMCNDDGTAYGACDSSLLLDGSLPPAPDASADTGGGDGGACSGTSNLGFLCPCTGDPSCTSGNCFTFPSKGLFCTQPCTKDSDCPPPSPGCTPKGVCKVP